MLSWNESRLWKELEARTDRGSSELRTDLASILADVSLVLLYGGTSPLDFTLHDGSHAFRVAQRMTSLPGLIEIKSLSCAELALLLLSAYLHDIGMTPERRKVSSHYEYLLSGAPGLLTKEEGEALQEWLDEFHPGTVPPIAKSQPSPKELRWASELVTYYCRFRHVDWGEEWTRETLGGRSLGNYTGWLDDLCRLCRSHHEDFGTLSRPEFNPRFVATSGDMVHLRYLACMLRISDIIEFDPERTPAVVLQHRAISPKSLVYWWRDKEIAFKAEKGRMLLSARPTSAPIHRALLELADAIDYELRICRRLADDCPFDIGIGGERLPHRWDLPITLHRDIRPRGDEYEYLDGTFRPDTERLLALLSGTDLYESPLAAIREVLQNAFDAVRESIAYQRLRESDAADERWDVVLGNVHQVALNFARREDGWWLDCTDTGIGMSKDHIRDALLVSGRAQRPDVLVLERKANERGILLNRTGQFGIGVLSYFMLSDHVVFQTRRSELAEPRETSGWTFSTDGVRAFGELKANRTCPAGTKVSLHLREELLEEDAANWIELAIRYAAAVVVRSPCRFVVMVENEVRYSRDAGWTLQSGDLGDFVATSMASYLTLGDTPDEQVETVPSAALEDLRSRLRFESEEGLLPYNSGRYRLHLPYFVLDGGDSLGWLQIGSGASNAEPLREVGLSTHVVLPTVGEIQSWRGIRIKSPDRDGELIQPLWGTRLVSTKLPGFDLKAIAEIDWTSPKAGTLAVSRLKFEETETGDLVLEWILARALGMARQFAVSRGESPYKRLNLRLAQVPMRPTEGEQWATEASGAEAGGFDKVTYGLRRLMGVESIAQVSWAPISLPVVSGIRMPGIKKWKWREREVTVVSSINVRRPWEVIGGRRTINLPSWNVSPDMIVVTPLGPAPLWISRDSDQMERDEDWALNRSEFPPAWNRVAAVRFDDYSGDLLDPEIVLNKRSWMTHLVTADSWRWAVEVGVEVGGRLEDEAQITFQQYVSLMLRCLSKRGAEHWEHLINAQASSFEVFWREIGAMTDTEEPEVVFLRGSFPFWSIERVSRAGWSSSMHYDPVGTEYFPYPSKEWLVVERDLSRYLGRRLGGWLGRRLARLFS